MEILQFRDLQITKSLDHEITNPGNVSVEFLDKIDSGAIRCRRSGLQPSRLGAYSSNATLFPGYYDPSPLCCIRHRTDHRYVQRILDLSRSGGRRCAHLIG